MRGYVWLPEVRKQSSPFIRLADFYRRANAMKAFRDERGATLVVSALSMALLLGFASLAADVGLLWRGKRIMQTAADAGALNGAAETPAGDWHAGGLAGSALNGVTDGVNGATVTVNKPPLYGAYTGNSNYVEVITSQTEQTDFMRVLGVPSVTVSARAVAYNTPGTACIITLATNPTPTGPGVSSPGAGISASSGSASLNATRCGIVDNGDESGQTAVNLSGGATIRALSLSTAGSVASSDLSDITVTNPSTVATGITPVSDPLAGTVSPPANPGGCTALTVSTSTTIGPSADGTICYSSLNISGGTTTLRPGVYYINGQLKIQSGANVNGTGYSGGEGVTFYITNTSSTSDSCPGTTGAGLCIAAGGTLNLSAPTTGSYAGILFYQNPSDTVTASFSGGSAGTISGIFYFPDAGLILSGGSGGTLDADLVVAWLNLSGGSTINQYEPLDVPSANSDPVLAE